MQMAPPTAKNPRENAGLFSYFTFAWFLPTVVKAYKRPLNEDDLFRVLEDHRGESLGDDLEYQWSKEKLRKRPSLLKAIIRTIGPWSIISYSIGGNILDFIKIYQVVLLIKLLECLSHKSRIQIDDIYLYAGLLVGCSMFVATTQHLYTFGSKQMGMKVRLALCSLLYRKSLKLSLKAAGTTVGPLITMLSNDVNRFDLFAIALNHLVSPALQIPTILFIIYHFMGWTGCIGVGLILISIPLQVIWGRAITNRKFRSSLKTDARIRLTTEAISHIKMIKMYGWEDFFEKLIFKIRNAEIALIRQANLIYSLIYAINHFTPEVPLLAAILTHIYLGNSIDAGYVYPLIMYYNLLKVTIMSYLGTAVLTFADIRVALKRFEKYLDSEEVEAPKMSNSLRERYSKASLPKALKENVGVTLTNATASWTGRENAIRNVSIRIPNEKLVAIVGPVGSGKSTLLNVILKELGLTDGTLEVVGAASYAAQEPCFFIGTIKDNILLGQMYDDTLYKKVVKICALEEDLSSFPSGDLTIVRDRGSNLSGGQRVRVNLARAMYRNADIYFLDEPLSGVDVSVAEHIFGQCIKDYLSDKCVLLVTNQLQFLQFVDYIYVLENGALVAEGTFDYLQKHRPQFLNLLQDTNEIGAKVTEYRASFEYAGRPMEVDEPEQIGDGYFNTNLLKIYAQGGGGFIVDLLVVLTLLIYYLALPTNNWFLSHWSNVDEKLSSQEQAGFSVKYSRNDHITFYISVVSILATAAVFYSMSCFLFFTQCNKTIHRKVFSKVIAAPMRFFYSNPSGTIINRFSRDLGIVDNYIIIAMMDVLDISLQILQIMVMIIVANTWLTPAVIFLLLLSYGLRRVYLPACVGIKHIEGIMRSPIFTHMKATLDGLPTVRALRKEYNMRSSFHRMLDRHTSTWYMYLASIHTFGITIDSLCAVFLCIVTFSFVFPVDVIPPAKAGLAITQSLMLIETVQWMMRQWNELAANMTSVERLVQYLSIEKEGENDNRTTKPPHSWGDIGNIEFQALSLKYNILSNPVLKTISFKVNAGEKVGIVGRTGAGKSSIITALFQLVQTEGNILIDDVDISKVPLKLLRLRFAVIPQEPVLFTSTIRKNLDPFNEYNDNQIWDALSDVEMHKVVAELAQGLVTNIPDGANFSVGQKQLLCLARAVLKNTKILVMDEPTANVDSNTDGVIQQTIRRKFAECTLLIIAHRIDTIISSDKVLVLELGEVKEFDHPYVLLRNKGTFYNMVQRTGESKSKILHESARKAYEKP